MKISGKNNGRLFVLGRLIARLELLANAVAKDEFSSLTIILFEHLEKRVGDCLQKSNEAWNDIVSINKHKNTFYSAALFSAVQEDLLKITDLPPWRTVTGNMYGRVVNGYLKEMKLHAAPTKQSG